ncbi:MAG: gliding motility-associated ABC transporter permease subunit GldF [Bacteroidales bacterium]|jgi:ABC-2 type transport system permease protein|nr:gliding motility-associated ABC transporter permease subunit GldF [Bacteroidales bacterium]
MIALFRKEIASFFSSLIGYLVISIFLLATGLVLWVFSGEMNILQSGYASLEGLFLLAPWIFLFLAPAISMRFFAEERKSGTLELLLTMPLSNMSIVLAKYFAAVVLLCIALIPTVLYVVTVYALGSPPGNLDVGATIGSYVGLIFLGAMYVAISIWVSSLTDSQIISFIVSAALCFVFFLGFDFVAELVNNGTLKALISYVGIRQHYDSISRGIIDTRDIVYFLSFIAFFLYLTSLSLSRKRK